MRTWFWLLAVGLVAWLGARGATTATPLYRVMQASHAAATGYALNDWVAIPPYENTQNLKVYGRELANSVGVAEPLMLSSGATFRKWSASDLAGAVATRTIAEALSSGTIYLVVDRSVAGSLTGFQESVAALNQKLAAYGTPHMTLTLTGELSGRLSDSQSRQLMSRMLAAVGAQEVNAITSTNLVSVSAMSPEMGPGLLYSGHHVNLEVAFSYDPATNRTEVLVGSPVISVTY